MQDVTITFTDGPLRGTTHEFEVGNVLIGRMPGEEGLELKGADTSVSRVHVELYEEDGDIRIKNRSPNGTTVNGKVVLGAVSIDPGARIQVGPRHSFTVSWTSFEGYTRTEDTIQKPAEPIRKGTLSSPIVRAVIAVYLLGILGVAIWLMISDGGETIAADDWPALSAAYTDYRRDHLSDDQRAERAMRAEALVRELRVIRTQGLNGDTKRICREIMSIDRDSKSPLYQYGVRCLSSL